MPNHVTNIVNFTGDKEKIAEMLEAIKDDEYGLGTIDFNKITPMPESLKITAGSQTERGLEYYKAFVDVYTLMGTRKGLDLLNIPEESEKVFLRARTDIDEETFTLGKAAYKNILQYGVPTWYDWSIKLGYEVECLRFRRVYIFRSIGHKPHLVVSDGMECTSSHSRKAFSYVSRGIL